ncbi:hypothetical protein CTAM01_09445 [Colletotrichum tamarilloi]|uniref:Uncharacterized protein n=1 Tax=Colletotrichum tamarilloi TaxID=1209934 RepID=A0ABQ9R3H1_9PEZI|nr:uncharacterized protein CTAM01_09445 [Colletotrichum tamarilloi]KAK1493301.1 hypothetical protein CTAM01_09445 [Colletotrichum tamarilloi]
MLEASTYDDQTKGHENALYLLAKAGNERAAIHVPTCQPRLRDRRGGLQLVTMLGTTKSRDPVEREKEGLPGGSCPVWLGIEEASAGARAASKEQGPVWAQCQLPSSEGESGPGGGEVQTSSPADLKSSCQEWGELWLCSNQQHGRKPR